MIGNLVRMFAGRAVGRQLGGIGGGPLGMAAGAALPFVMRRFGPMGMIGAAVGGYALNKYMAKRNAAGVAGATGGYLGETEKNIRNRV